MPVVRVQREELKKFHIDEKEFVENVAMLGADLKGMDKDEIMVEFFPDRPDLYSVEGIARAMRGFLGQDLGIVKYEAKEPRGEVFVDENLRHVRPYFVGAIIRNLKIDKLMIKSLMDFQEKLHVTIGRKRKKIAIGLHDFDQVKMPFYYVGKAPDFSFSPLGFDEEMPLADILKKHPKGREYGWIVEKYPVYPVILDSKGNVLSFPPIINGNLTQVTENTQNIFVDITGTDLNVMNSALNIIVTALADRGGEIEKIKINYGKNVIITPNLKYKKMKLDKNYMEKILGIELGDEDVVQSLKKMRYDVNYNNGIYEITIPPYRMDILHPVDLIEDIAKGYRYDRFGYSLPTKYVPAMGEIDEKERLIMIGLGFMEVVTLTLTSFREEYDMMGIEREKNVVVENPISENTQTLRTWLIPSLMGILRKNKHNELPQKIFEVGYIRSDKIEKHLAFVAIDSSVNFTQCKSYVEAILRDLNVKNYSIEEKQHGSFIDGRCVSLVINGKEIGLFGEIHPQVIENFELRYPVIGAEINMDSME